jgi:photosystem II stability/assembly factor-like uncharacterized protein
MARTAAAIGLALALAAAAVPVVAAGPGVLRQGIAHDALYDLCFDARGGVAVGAAGTLLEAGTAGEDWRPHAGEPLTTLALLGAGCGGGRRLAVGQVGTMLLDEGSGWTRVESGTGQRLLAADLDSAGLAFAVGGFGTVLRSRDGGRHWESLAFDWQAIVEDFAEPHLYAVEVAEDGVVTIVGEFEMVLRSTDGGDSWMRVHRGDASLFGLHLRPDGAGFAVGQQGRVLATRDGGASWQVLDTGQDASLLDVWSAPDGSIVASGMRTMLSSSDAGESWRVIEGADIATGWYAGLAEPTAGAGTRLVSAGHTGRVLVVPVPVR